MIEKQAAVLLVDPADQRRVDDARAFAAQEHCAGQVDLLNQTLATERDVGDGGKVIKIGVAVARLLQRAFYFHELLVLDADLFLIDMEIVENGRQLVIDLLRLFGRLEATNHLGLGKCVVLGLLRHGRASRAETNQLEYIVPGSVQDE